MKPARIPVLIAGVLIGLAGLGMALGGLVLTVASTQRDAAGYLTSSPRAFSTTTYALTTRISVAGSGDATWLKNLASIRLHASGAGSDAIFIGVAREADVKAWLAATSREEVTDPTNAHPAYLLHPGTQAPGAPGAQTFWVASTSDSAHLLTWPLTPGSWDVVVMNADGHAGVHVALAGGVRLPWLVPIAVGLAIAGLLVLGAGIALFAFSLAGRAAPQAAQTLPAYAPGGAPVQDLVPAGAPSRAGGSGAPAYPVRVDGHLDDRLSPWLWLVKVFLVIPHMVVLVFLWLAFAVLSVGAWFAILVTGQYPRGIFEFNVGVMRWTWRVGFYAFAAFGTDRYPPFSLADDPAYPAHLEVDYPEHLSRGLALVKWWLLAIPHYLIVGVLVGSTAPLWRAGAFRFIGGGGLIGLLALVAAVVLLIRRQYPNGLFDFVMGLNRWVWRVAAYAGLMRDEYPPFRLDTGGTDPGTASPPATAGPTPYFGPGPVATAH